MLRTFLVAAGGVGLLALVEWLGADSVASALGHVRGWPFVPICAV